MKDEEVITNRDDVEMIRRQHLWPNPLMLPLKRYEDNEIIVAIVRDVDVKPGEVRVNKNASLFGVIGPLEVLSYESPEAAVEDGWRVD